MFQPMDANAVSAEWQCSALGVGAFIWNNLWKGIVPGIHMNT